MQINKNGGIYLSFLVFFEKGDEDLRRLARIMSFVVVFTLLVASVALAETIRCTNTECVGTNEADVINGNDEDQNFDARAGNDIIFAGGGIDTIEGDEGADEIFGEEGDDTIFGGDGVDMIEGNEGIDTIFGGNGADTIEGNEDNDRIDGQAGSDTVDGGNGDDRINDLAGDDRDTLFGNAGNDRLNDADGGGRDIIRGGTGDDVCIGDRGDTFKGCEVERIR